MNQETATASESSPVIVSCDTGFSDTKVATTFGDPFRFPSTVALATEVPTGLDGHHTHESTIFDGEEWFVGLPQNARFAVDISEDFYRSPQHRAIVNAAINRAGEEHIDVLALALPSALFRTKRVDELKKTYTGRITINDKAYTVERVEVLNQPLGAVGHLLDTVPTLANQHADRIVLDIGRGTSDVEYVTSDMEVLPNHAMSSHFAMSSVWHALSDLIPLPSDPERLALMIINGDQVYSAQDQSIDLPPLFEKAVDIVAPDLIGQLKANVRDHSRVGDLFLAGGGAMAFEQHLRDAFPELRVRVPSDPIMANALGWMALVKHSGLAHVQ